MAGHPKARSRRPRRERLAIGFAFALILGLTGASAQEQPDLFANAKLAYADWRFDDAIEQMSLWLETEDDLARRPFGFQILGESYRQKGELELAGDAFEEAKAAVVSEGAEELSELSDDMASYVLTMHAWAEVYCWGAEGQMLLDVGLYDRAEAPIQREYELAFSKNDDGTFRIADNNVRSDSLLHRCNLALAQERNDLVHELAARVIEGEEGLETSPQTRVSFHLLRGQASFPKWRGCSKEQEAECEEHLRNALGLVPTGSSHRLEALTSLLHLYLLVERLDDAEATLRELESLELNPRNKKSAHIRETLACLLELRRDQASRETLDRMQAAYDQFLAFWKSGANRRLGVGFLNFGVRRLALVTLLECAIEVFKEEGPSYALEQLMRAQGFGVLTRDFDEGTDVGLDALKSVYLRADHGLLVYLNATTGMHLIAADENAVHHYPLGEPREIERLSNALNRAVSSATSDRDSVDEVARDLAQRVLPRKCQERLQQWKRVTIVGREFINAPLFECLPIDDRTLGLDWAVDSLASLPFAVGRLQQQSGMATSSKDLALIFGPAHGEVVKERISASPIREDKDTIELLFSPFAKERVTLRSGEAATETALSHLDLGDHRILHILSHGITDLDREGYAGLVMYSDDPGHDGGLFSDEVTFDAPPLVVLSVCGGARSPIRLGDETVAHLGGAFLGAGAHAVVLSEKNLDYEATCWLVSMAQERLARGQSPAEAFRGAREELAKNPRFAHPCYYANVQVIGLGHEPLFPASAGPFETGAYEAKWRKAPWRVILGAFVLILGIGIVYRRHHKSKGPR